jgi:hypothetical protein
MRAAAESAVPEMDMIEGLGRDTGKGNKFEFKLQERQ